MTHRHENQENLKPGNVSLVDSKIGWESKRKP